MKSVFYLSSVILVCLFISNCASPMSAGLPNLEKAFTKTLMVNKQVNDNKKSYRYMTAKDYPTAKAEFDSYIGDDWFSIQSTRELDKTMEDSIMKAVKSNTKGKTKAKLKVNGSSIYLNSKYPDARLMMVHLSPSPVLNIIMVEYEYMVAEGE